MKRHYKRIKKIDVKYKMLVAGSFILMCLIIGLSLYNFVRQVQFNNSELLTLNNQRVADLINTEITSINKAPAEDPMTGTLYIPEAHIVLPPINQTFGSVVYAYYSAAPAELHIASTNDILGAEATLSNNSDQSVKTFFDQVPKLQACARGITISFERQTGKTIVYQKMLADKRLAYFYDEQLCLDPSLLHYAEQLNTYSLL